MEAEVEASQTLAYQRALRERLAELRQEHLDLAASIEALGAMPVPDQLTIARLKRRKLALKDEITRLDDEILPDIIA
ncbi:MAG: YdcH family protein [Brevundimonas sp.]|uniref:YdcH family protein n=1 Tax=Brevundimonas sp. TaxID=1871086 RepID=UPI00391DC418